MSLRYQFILGFIRSHTIDNPITCADLARQTLCSTRTIQEIVEQLRKDALPIGSTSRGRRGQMGYYWARTPDELDDTLAHFRSRLRSIAVVRAGLKRAQRILYGVQPQSDLFLEMEHERI